MTLPGTSLRRVTLFTADPWESAMTYLRVLGPARLARVECLSGNQAGRFDLESITPSDLVILQRDFPRFPGYGAVVDRARRENKPVVYEIDDLVLEVPPGHVSHPALVDHLGSLLKCAVEADAVVTSSRLLRDYYAALNPRAVLFPNYLADDLLPPRPPAESLADHPLVIGYMGGASHLPDLELIRPVLLPLLSELTGLTLRIWGVRPSQAYLDHPRVEWVPMDIPRYPDFARQLSRQACDLWVAPLADTLFNRGKSSVKFLEYTALGAAGVYSRLRPYEEVVVDGENGLLAGSLEEWDAGLRRLIHDPGLRARLACSASTTVQERWRMSVRYPEWVSIYETILKGGSGPLPGDVPRDPSPALQTVVRVVEQFQARHTETLQERHTLAEELHAIRSSRSWRWITRLGRLRQRIQPARDQQD